MKQNNSYEWTKFVDSAMKIYLNWKHRTIKMSPLEATKDENEYDVRRTYYLRYIKAGKKNWYEITKRLLFQIVINQIC